MTSLASFVQMTEFFGDHASAANASWLIGENFDLAALGEVGEAVQSARTLGGALRRLADNFELLQDVSRMQFDAEPDSATISYRILDPSIWPRHQDALFSLGIISRIIKMAVPDAATFMELGFECRKRDTGLTIGDGQIAFECEANSIRIPAAMLDMAMPETASTCDLRQLSMRLAERRRQRPAREKLASIIYARLADGDINQDHLASEIGMSSRTMRRRLAHEETSFQLLLDECRMRQAVLEFQARPDASIAQIALRLGYAEHSTFTRAFTRWAGMPPHRFRAQLNTTKH
jgi:AraC-like DNA-binding protein